MVMQADGARASRFFDLLGWFVNFGRSPWMWDRSFARQEKRKKERK
jgi:hypothetical protein